MNVDQVKAKLQAQLEKLRATTEPFARVAVFLDRWVQKNFQTEGGNVGGWAPLRRGGRVKNGKLDTSAMVLQDTGRLRASFLPFHDKDLAGIGSDVPYAIKHEEGQDGLPIRRMLPTEDEVKKEVTKILEKHVEDAFK